MKNPRLRQLIFWALIIDLSIIGKRLIMPGSNLITDALHIPGGIGTGFSLMFIVIAAEYEPFPWCCSMISAVQGGIQLITGHVGSMGAFAPIGYIVPGIVMDLVMQFMRRYGRRERIIMANTAAAVSAALIANLIVFHLGGIALLLYISIAALSGALFALLGDAIGIRIFPALRRREGNHRHEEKL